VHSRGLAPWSDPANADPRHLRSWLRTTALPLLRTRIPELDRHLLRAGTQAAADRAAWDALLDALPDLACQTEPDGISVAVPPLRGYDSNLASAIVRAAARRAGCTVGPVRARRVVEMARSGASGAVVPLGAGWQAELAFGRLRVVLTGARAETAAAAIVGDTGDCRWGRWRLRWRLEPAPAAQDRRGLSAWFEPGAMEVRSWQPGDRVRPLAGRGRRLVVRCFQDARVPKSQRESWPVLAADDGVLWVPGVCRSDQRLPRAGAEALRVDVDGI
jgi:tRNA(Ile)-lysidine synthetase-like protein